MLFALRPWAAFLTALPCFAGLAGPCPRDKRVTDKKELAIFHETYYENRDFEVSSFRPFSALLCVQSSRSRWKNVTCSSYPLLGDAYRLDSVYTCVPRLSASVSSLAVHETLMAILFGEGKGCPRSCLRLESCGCSGSTHFPPLGLYSSLRTLDVFEILASSARHASQAPCSF